jgi:hypothetical protein
VSDIVDPIHGTHVNRLTVVLHSIKSLSEQSPLATVVLIVDSVRLNRDELRRQVERVHWTRDEQGRPTHEPFLLDENFRHVSWGADGASLEFILQVGSWVAGGIVGNAAYDALKEIGQQISTAGRSSASEPMQIDDQIAIRRAQQIAAAAFKDLDFKGFTILSVSVVDSTATVIMRYKDGSTFNVQPSMLDGGHGAIGPIVRVYPES